ncbi:MAG: (d)CMP kinase [Alphaproteobacteria bacterium]|nr:(d)CMP kinase [Alphaproteobacteria bacterium]
MSQINFRRTDFVAGQQSESLSADKKLVIAIDGPAASGKGTLARRLAERLGFAYLETGALYRAVALATLEIGGDPTQFKDVAPALEIIKRNLTPELLENAALRTPEVSAASSQVAALPEVREALRNYQRAFALTPPEGFGGAVLDGRDIGTVVCPDADIKLFVTATPEVRAQRRYAESKQACDGLTLEKVAADIKARDARDAARKTSPMRAAEDAYVLDTTSLSIPEVLEETMAVIRSKFLERTAARVSA